MANTYPSKYRVRGFGNLYLDVSPLLNDLQADGIISPNVVLPGSNCYAGYNMEGDALTGAYSIMSWGDNYLQYNIRIAKTPSTKTNLRFVCNWSSMDTRGNILTNVCFRWTGISDDLAEAYNTATGSFYTYNAYNTLTNQKDASFNFGTERSYFNLSFVNSLQVNSLILLPTFIIYQVTLSNIQEGEVYYNRSIDNSWVREWDDIKPKDNTPQGQYYDDDLYNKGYKIISQDDNHITFQYVYGCNIQPYYGNPPEDTREALGIISESDNNPTSKNGTLYRYWQFGVIQETYIPELGGVVYSTIPGLQFYPWTNGSFSSNSGNITSPTDSQYELINRAEGYAPLTSDASSDIGYGLIPNITQRDDALPPENQQIVFTNLLADISTDYSNVAGYSSTYDRWRYLGNGNYGNVFSSAISYTPSYNQCYSIKQLWSTIASLGLYVASNQNIAETVLLGKQASDDNLYCGEMLDDGTTTGVMIQGEDIKNLPQADMDDILQDTPYVPVDPNPPVPPEPDTDKDGADTGTVSPAGKITIGATNGFVTYYALSSSQIQAIGKSLWRNNDPASVLKNFFLFDFDRSDTNYELSYAEVLDYFVSLKYFPFNIPAYADTKSTGEQGIRIGTGATLIDAGPVISTDVITNPIAVIDGGTCTVPSYYKSFMDSEPIAVASMYVPFCGTVEVQLSAITDKPLTLTYYVDMVTGCCIALVQATSVDGVYPVAELTGVIGFDMLLTGNNHNQQLSSIMSSLRHTAIGSLGSLTSAVMGAGYQSPTQVVSGLSGAATSIASTAIDMPQTASLQPMTTGSASSLASLASYHTAFIQVRRKNSVTPANYGDTVGYIANQTQSIGSITGFTQCVNPNLTGIPATADEIEMIREILISGFYA